VAAEENVGNSSYAERKQWACVLFMYACRGMDEFYDERMDGACMPKLTMTTSLPGSLEQSRMFSGR